MSDNTYKRDILIFPKFKNINRIQEIRNKFDKLANLIPPHITLVFPFSDSISDQELVNKLSNLLYNWSSFCIKFHGISLSEDGYIFLNCINGCEEIIKLHDEIYEKILPSHYKKTIKYVPHITLGQADSLEKLSGFNDSFNSVVAGISVELIGKNEESIIIKNIDFGIKIRKVIYEDCFTLSKLKKEIWETTYRGIYPDTKIDHYDYIENENRFKDFINDKTKELYVVVANNELVGYIEFGSTFKPFKDYKKEIGLLYIRKDYQKKGLGKNLFNLAYNSIKETGSNNFFISCHKYNVNARKFYEKMGGKIIYEDVDDLANNGIPQVKYEYIII